jgi:hypothetical protein
MRRAHSGTKRHFYVYAYVRPEHSEYGPDGTPYYIGKGSGKRAWTLHKKRSGIIRPADNRLIKIIKKNLTEPEAFDLEKRLIRKYGRIDTGSGCLVNLTDGGDGISGLIFTE